MHGNERISWLYQWARITPGLPQVQDETRSSFKGHSSPSLKSQTILIETWVMTLLPLLALRLLSENIRLTARTLLHIVPPIAPACTSHMNTMEQRRS